MTDNFFTIELNNLKTETMKMGGLVEEMLVKAIEALFSSDLVKAQEVIDWDKEINAQEIKIINHAVLLMATNQPVASDLRRLVATLRIAAELERSGDISANIGRRTKGLAASDPDRKLPAEIAEMAKMAKSMLSSALDAVARNDAALAKEVMAQDDALDSLNHHVRAMMLDNIEANGCLVRWGLEVINAAGHFERLGDHATNLAEEVIFIAKGQNVRHLEQALIRE